MSMLEPWETSWSHCPMACFLNFSSSPTSLIVYCYHPSPGCHDRMFGLQQDFLHSSSPFLHTVVRIKTDTIFLFLWW
jgi:hypothetical protein